VGANVSFQNATTFKHFGPTKKKTKPNSQKNWDMMSHVGCKVLTELNRKSAIFRDVTPCSSV
jgi:hypothetical protein